MMIKSDEKELISLLGEYLEAKGNQERDSKLHDIKLRIHNLAFNVICKNELDATSARLEKYGESIIDKEVNDNYYLYYCDAFEEIFKKFAENDIEIDLFVKSLRKRYKIKSKEEESSELKEKDPEGSEAKKQHVRKYLRKIAEGCGIAPTVVTKELKRFNLLNHKSVEGFLRDKCKYDDEGIKRFDEKIWDVRLNESFDSVYEGEDGSSESIVENMLGREQVQILLRDEALCDDGDNKIAHAKLQEIRDYRMIDALLAKTYEAKKAIRDTEGFWTLFFIEADTPEERARERDRYIILMFFLKNKYLYNEFEDKYVNKYRDMPDDLSDAKQKTEWSKIHRKKISELHKELMPRMAKELELKQDTWRRAYKKAEKRVWHAACELKFLWG